MKTPDIRLLRLRALALVTVAGTAWISFSSSQDLAVRAGFGVRAWAFPVCLDAVAAFAVDVWMRRTGAQRAAAWLALTAIGLSLASNVADHYLTAGTALAALLGGIPPAMLAWLLLVLHKHGQPAKAAPAPEPVQLADPAPVADAPTKSYVDQATTPPPDGMIMPIWWKHPYEDALPQEPEPEVHTPPHTPVSTPVELVKPLAVNEPDNDPERTQIMPRITDEEPGKFDPTAADPAPAKVQPARKPAPEVSAEVAQVSRASLSNEDLIQLAIKDGNHSRRAIATAYGLGTNRAGSIARAVKEKING